MLEHAVALGGRKRPLGKGREQARIRMEQVALGPGSPQTVIYDFGYFSHCFPLPVSVMLVSVY
jgi:hypothetical protein